MTEQNGQTESPQSLSEVCTIRVMFPVESDEQAILIKRSIQDLLKGMSDSQVHFGIMPNPTQAPYPKR